MKKIILYLLPIASFLFTGCAPVISKQVRTQVRKNLTLSVVSKNPKDYEGETVLWSGIIVKSQNTEEGTLIEVLQKPTNRRGKPKDVDRSEGHINLSRNLYQLEHIEHIWQFYCSPFISFSQKINLPFL